MMTQSVKQNSVIRKQLITSWKCKQIVSEHCYPIQVFRKNKKKLELDANA